MDRVRSLNHVDSISLSTQPGREPMDLSESSEGRGTHHEEHPHALRAEGGCPGRARSRLRRARELRYERYTRIGGGRRNTRSYLSERKAARLRSLLPEYGLAARRFEDLPQLRGRRHQGELQTAAG